MILLLKKYWFVIVQVFFWAGAYFFMVSATCQNQSIKPEKNITSKDLKLDELSLDARELLGCGQIFTGSSSDTGSKTAICLPLSEERAKAKAEKRQQQRYQFCKKAYQMINPTGETVRPSDIDREFSLCWERLTPKK